MHFHTFLRFRSPLCDPPPPPLPPPELAVSPAPTYDAKWLSDLHRRTRVPRDRLERQLGTLGGGNHFIEIDRDGEQAYVAVHSGSRGIGQGICNHHQDIITSGTRKDWSGYEKAERSMRKKVRSMETRSG
jgi:RNA-splicing ligase RtcB